MTGKAIAFAVIVLCIVLTFCTPKKVLPQSAGPSPFLVVLEPPASARILCCRIVRFGELGYVATGSRLYLDGRSRGWAVRLDPQGKRVWERQWFVGGSSNALLTDGLSTPSSSAYLVGSAALNQNASGLLTVAAVLKIDSRAEVIWTKLLPLGPEAQAEAVTPAPNGGIVVAGWTRNSAGAKSLFLVSLNREGHVLWQRTLPFSDDLYGIRLVQTRPDGYLASGSFGLVRLDQHGIVRWQRMPGDTFVAIETTDGSVVALSNRSQGQAQVVELNEFDRRGERTMSKVLDGACWISGAWALTGNHIVVAERRCSDDRVNWISRLSRGGKRESSARLDIPDHASPLEVQPDGPDVVVAAGMFAQDSPDAVKGWVFRSGRLQFNN